MVLPIHETFYIEVLAYHTTVIVEHATRVKLELQEMVNNKRRRPVQQVAESLLNALQDIISHAASISRYFWPVRKNAEHLERGELLRSVYAVDESSPLCNRGVRNAIEHFDEKLDTFLASFPTGTIYPSYVGSRHKISGNNVHCFRAYFVDEQVFKILDAEIYMPPVIDEVKRIQGLLVSQIDNGLRF